MATKVTTSDHTLNWAPKKRTAAPPMRTSHIVDNAEDSRKNQPQRMTLAPQPRCT